MRYTEALEVPIKSKLLDQYCGVIYELVSKEDWYIPSANSSPSNITYYKDADPLIDINKSYPHKFAVRKIFTISKGRVFRASSRIEELPVHRLILYNYTILNTYIEFQKKIITQLSTYCKNNIDITSQNNLSSSS